MMAGGFDGDCAHYEWTRPPEALGSARMSSARDEGGDCRAAAEGDDLRIDP